MHRITWGEGVVALQSDDQTVERERRSTSDLTQRFLAAATLTESFAALNHAVPMSLDLASMHAFITEEVASTRELAVSMQRVIDECANHHAHEDWTALRELPYDAMDELRDWIERPFHLDPPKTTLAGLWFGLFNPEYAGEVVADIYVCGSRRFIADRDDNSWAIGPDWWPEHRYAHSSILRDVYQIAYRQDGLGNDAEYPICLAFGALAVRDLLWTARPEIILGQSRSIGAAVGFDSGDFVLVGSLSHNGLEELSAEP